MAGNIRSGKSLVHPGVGSIHHGVRGEMSRATGHRAEVFPKMILAKGVSRLMKRDSLDIIVPRRGTAEDPDTINRPPECWIVVEVGFGEGRVHLSIAVDIGAKSEGGSHSKHSASGPWPENGLKPGSWEESSESDISQDPPKATGAVRSDGLKVPDIVESHTQVCQGNPRCRDVIPSSHCPADCRNRVQAIVRLIVHAIDQVRNIILPLALVATPSPPRVPRHVVHPSLECAVIEINNIPSLALRRPVRFELCQPNAYSCIGKGGIDGVSKLLDFRFAGER